MEDILENLDVSKYKWEARIYSTNGKHEKIFTDEAFVEKLNQCKHFTALYHETKDIILEVEKILLPLKPRAASLMLETKGGSVIARMTLEDFFSLLEIAKRTEISDRFHKAGSQAEEVSKPIDEEVQEFLGQLGDE